MKTFLLKLSCLFLFGFIFFQSFQTNNNVSNQLLSEVETPHKESLSPNTVVIAVEVSHSSKAGYETKQGITNNLAIQ